MAATKRPYRDQIPPGSVKWIRNRAICLLHDTGLFDYRMIRDIFAITGRDAVESILRDRSRWLPEETGRARNPQPDDAPGNPAEGVP